MLLNKLITPLCVLIASVGFSQNPTENKNIMTQESTITTENIRYTCDNKVLQGMIAFDSKSTSKRPIVLVIHEWWGINNYMARRIKQLAELGYLAMAVDLYGINTTANSVEEAVTLSTPLYQNAALAKQRFDSALQLIKKNNYADTSKIAIIGYCFGGSMALNFAKMGENVKGVVSFHGGLKGVTPQKKLLTAKILICHGADDQFVKKEEVDAFKKEMDAIDADYIFKEYAGATHAFSNTEATGLGKKFQIPIAYNKAADVDSWNEMKKFLRIIFK